MSGHTVKHNWVGYPMVRAIRSQRFYIGERSGLLVADGPEFKNGQRIEQVKFVQKPDETPADFWKRVLEAVGETCVACGQKIVDGGCS